MNALWNHFVFPVIGTAKRAFIFNLSAALTAESVPAHALLRAVSAPNRLIL
jgi:hypothetical protein